MNKEKALAICFAYLKGPKDKPIDQLVLALEHLRSLPEYSTNAKVGEAVGVSAETVREFLSIGKLPEDIRKQVKSLEHGRRLWQLARQRPSLLDEAAELLPYWQAHDFRHLVDYLVRNPNSTVEEAKHEIISSKTVVQHMFHVIAELEQPDYFALREAANRQQQNINDLVTTIIVDWLKQN